MTGPETLEPAGLVLAQAAAPQGGIGPLVPIILMFAVVYFLVLRPQQRKQKEHQTMVDGLKKNDRVVTISGLHGRIVELGDAVVTLEIAKGVHVRQERTQIGSVATTDRKEE